MSAPQASVRLKSIQRTALTMLVVSGVVNYVDRATLAVANPLIREDLGLGVADMGILLSAFLWSYAFAQLPTGAMVDRLGPRRLLSLGLTLWSARSLSAGWLAVLVSSSGRVSRLASGGHRNSRQVHALCAIGSMCADAAQPPAFLIVPRHSAQQLPRPC